MIIGILFIFLFVASWLVAILFGRLRHIPGPLLSKISQLYLKAFDFSYTRNDKILEWHRRYGPVICLSPTHVSVGALADAKEIYGATQKWVKSDYFDTFQGYGVRSAFSTKPYKEHQTKRKLISAFYQASNIFKDPKIEQHIWNRAEAVLRQVRLNELSDVYSLTDWFALDNITFLTLGPVYGTSAVDHPGPERTILRDLKYQQFMAPFRTLHPRIFDIFSGVLAKWIPSLGYLLADERLASWCWQRASQAMDDPSLHASSSLLRCLASPHESLHHDQPPRHYIAAEVLDNINAAEATVAVTATYLIWRLTENPEWQKRIRNELKALPKREDGSFCFSDIHSQAPSLDVCVREVLRLHPASSGRAERVVPKGGWTLSGVFVPEETVVSASVLALHYDQNIFPDPDRFAPERWLVEDEIIFRRLDSHLISFGIGGRVCLGKSLAIMEIKVLIAVLFLEYETVPTPACNAESMKQCSTHDAVPKALECKIRFQAIRS